MALAPAYEADTEAVVQDMEVRLAVDKDTEPGNPLAVAGTSVQLAAAQEEIPLQTSTTACYTVICLWLT
jgi:hypothetical protein